MIPPPGWSGSSRALAQPEPILCVLWSERTDGYPPPYHPSARFSLAQAITDPPPEPTARSKAGARAGGEGGAADAGTVFTGDCSSRCAYRMIMNQSYFSSTRPVVVLNVYVAPPSWCLASADHAEAVADRLLNSTLSVFLNP
jgi:hypothetical protein